MYIYKNVGLFHVGLLSRKQRVFLHITCNVKVFKKKVFKRLDAIKFGTESCPNLVFSNESLYFGPRLRKSGKFYDF